MVCVWSGVRGSEIAFDLAWRLGVLISVRGGWANRAGLGRRSHLELKRSLNLDLQGVDLLCVDLLFVERRRQRDDEW